MTTPDLFTRALHAADDVAPEVSAVELALIVRAVLAVVENERVRLVAGNGWR